jgi:putative effector of murein hydrolase
VPEHLRQRPLSALPSRLARILAFVAIVVGGILGGVIGYALVKLQCNGSCSVPESTGALIGSLVCAAGTAIVVVLGLRAMGEWRELNDKR